MTSLAEGGERMSLAEGGERMSPAEGGERMVILKRFNKALKEWGPLVWTFIGTVAAICFGVFSILAFLDAKAALKEARAALREAMAANNLTFAALEAAWEANSLARQANEQGSYANQLTLSGLLLAQIENCREFDMYKNLTMRACASVAIWADNYAVDLENYNKPIPPSPTVTAPPTETPYRPSSLSEFYPAAQQETEGSISTPGSFVLGLGPVIAIAVVAIAIGVAKVWKMPKSQVVSRDD